MLFKIISRDSEGVLGFVRNTNGLRVIITLCVLISWNVIRCQAISMRMMSMLLRQRMRNASVNTLSMKVSWLFHHSASA